MLLVWGTRAYGRVDGFERQFAVTQFFHVWFLPVIPLGSTWVTEDLGDRTNGHAIRLSGKSLAAAYLRTWGLLGGALAATIGVVSGALVPAAIGAAVTGAGAATFRWRSAANLSPETLWHYARGVTASNWIATPRTFIQPRNLKGWLHC